MPTCIVSLAAVNITRDDLTKSRYHQERALALNPNYDLVVVQQGELLTWLGNPEEGIEWIRKAMRLNPHHPERFWSHLGKAHFTARQYGEAIEAFMHLSTTDYVHHAFPRRLLRLARRRHRGFGTSLPDPGAGTGLRPGIPISRPCTTRTTPTSSTTARGC